MKTVFDSKGNQVDLIELKDIESSNDYIKFPDGTMIQLGTYSHIIEKDNVTNSSFRVPLKLDFVKSFKVFVSNVYSHSNNVIYSPSYDDKSNSFVIYFHSNNPLNKGNTVDINYMAIGKWK